jgi:hypothetical protein
MTLAFVMFGYLMFEITVKFLEEKIVLQLSSEEVPIKNIPFPAVTICPEVVLDKSFHGFDRKLYSPSDEKCEKHLRAWRCDVFTICHSSDAFLHFIEFIQSQLNQSNQTELVFDYINSTLQTVWVKRIESSWRIYWEVPCQMILTKWGFCFSFNLLPLMELINMEK